MKSTSTCPKCGARDLIRVPGFKGGWGGIPTTFFVRGNLQPSRYICGQCGFVEEYVDVPEHLEAIRRKHGESSRKSTSPS